jgi:hypothetical protein
MTERARLAAARLTSGRPALRQTPTSTTRFQGRCAANTNTASQAGAPAATSIRASSVANRLTTPPPRTPQSQKARPRGRPPRQNSRIVSISVLPPTPRVKNTARVLACGQKDEVVRQGRLNRRDLQGFRVRRSSGTYRKPISSRCLSRASGGAPRRTPPPWPPCEPGMLWP